MQVWRLSRPEFARRLDGGGNRETGARWNSPGRGVVYTSRSLALCVLETLVHLPSIRFVQGLVAVRIDIPDDAGVEIVAPADLPPDRLAEEGAVLALRALGLTGRVRLSSPLTSWARSCSRRRARRCAADQQQHLRAHQTSRSS